ncbi:DUF2007 domain-containing protein [Gilvimarinus xylanilyticus]|uniref:DUF2007 domain-containing protein n=1 Tax=Gilvimarinus xylanilyticus TaxID=2944139 RepID=A0A9X2HX18_9GAMM|nr:DUF2007 domain-containing protein [Gilvimarinus xylanilyticus]MCP8899710.1 DUF2007 domain-containing protein [Gilvimarinus xylanilyticus]
MKLVYTHENKLLVENTANLLRQKGIESTLENEFAAGAMGELSPLQTWPELWVNEGDYLHAKGIIAQLAETAMGAPWQCPACSEENDASFELCWSCQQEKP